MALEALLSSESGSRQKRFCITSAVERAIKRTGEMYSERERRNETTKANINERNMKEPNIERRKDRKRKA